MHGTKLKTLHSNDVIEHDRLFELYPDLKNVKTEIEYGNTGAKAIGQRIVDDKGRDKIILRPDNNRGGRSKDLISTLRGVILQKIQHIIQSKEGNTHGVFT